MDILIATDGVDHLVCTLRSHGGAATVTAPDPAAAGEELLAALDEARASGYGECFWPAATGEYRWMFRRTDDRLRVVALWSSGTLTGWEQVADDETGFEAFVSQVREGLAAIGAGPS